MNEQYRDLSDQYANKEEGYYEQQRPEMLEFIPENCRFILDVGCSSGGFGESIKKERPGTVVWGIEPNEKECESASKKLDKAICGIFSSDTEGLLGQKFDCIVFNDVLEHVANPEEILKLSKNFLTENGSVVASIPNVLHFYNIWQILTQQDWKYEDSGIMDNTHLRFFTKKSIIRLFESSGFEIENVQGINPSFGVKYKIANTLTLGKLVEWKFVQFGIQARPWVG